MHNLAKWSVLLIVSVLPFCAARADVSPAATPAANSDKNPPTVARELLDRWLSIRQQISAIDSQWQQQQQQLNLRLQLLKQEKQQLQSIVQASNSNTGEVEQERQQLLGKQHELEHEQQQLTDTLSRLWPQLRSALPRLPPPLALAWQQQLTSYDEQAPQSEQLETLLTLLRSLRDFQQRLSTDESLITISDSQTLLARQLYLGATRAWFVTADRKYTGTGQADALGWHWTLDPEISAEAIETALAMLEQNKNIGFVALPVSLASTGDQP